MITQTSETDDADLRNITQNLIWDIKRPPSRKGKYELILTALRQVRDTESVYNRSLTVIGLMNRLAEAERELAAEKEARQQYDEAARIAASETCTKGEQHCTCVPLLRTTIQQQGLKLQTAVEALKRVSYWYSASLDHQPPYVQPVRDAIDQIEKGTK